MIKKRGTFLAAFLAGMAILTLLDQWTKSLAVRHLMNQKPVVLIPDVFQLYYSENRGAAFGMLQGGQTFFMVVTLAVLGSVAYSLWRIPLKKRFAPLAFCLLLLASGAAGNMIDRALQGYVVDFLYFSLINFPIFNVADCYVVCACIAFVLLILFYYKDDDFSFLKRT